MTDINLNNPNAPVTPGDPAVTPREIDFVTRFGRTWTHLRELLGLMTPIRKQPGALLKSKYAEGTLESGAVAEGQAIPYSQFTVREKDYGGLTVEKYAKAVTIEAITEHGYENAVQMTDNEFLYQLQTNVTDRFYRYLNTGELRATETTYQMALAMAKGLAENKFKLMHRSATGTVGFANVLDVYQYLGAQPIAVHNQFGFQYVKDFMGYQALFLLSENEIPRGRVIATPVENISLYYVDPASSEYARSRLVYAVDPEIPLIGFHTAADYRHAVSECFAIMGLALFAEYIDAIAVVTVDEDAKLAPSSTVTSAEGSQSGQTRLTVAPEKGLGHVYKVASAAAPQVAYAQNVSAWDDWDGESELTLATGQKVTVVEADASMKALKAGSATVAAKA